ncbi:esterase/lipase family protein [Spirillospora sp. NPDC050679]
MQSRTPCRSRWAAKLVALAAAAPVLAATVQTAPALAAPASPTAAAQAAAAPVAAAAAPRRADAKNRAVYFIHGYQREEGKGQDCRMWDKTKKHFRNQKWTGGLITWGYYKADKNCTVEYGGNQNTDLKYVSRSLAWDIYNRYTSKGKTVDVVAHSMGGLVIRNAIARVKRGHDGFPPRLYVEDVVTLGTPHGGSDGAKLCWTTQCKQMRVDGGHLKWLNGLPNSNFQATGGTNWTLLASYDDNAVSAFQGTAFYAKHKVRYPSNENVEHSDYYKTGLGNGWDCYRSSDYGKKFKTFKNACAGPINSAYVGAYFHSAR